MTEALIPPRSGASSKSERHQFWQEVIGLHKQSNLKRHDFCEKHGLKRSDFSRWHYRLNKTSKQSINGSPAISANLADEKPQFIELHQPQPKAAHYPEDSSSSHDSEHFMIRLKNGAEIMIPNTFSQEALSKIILTLEATL